MMNTRQLGRSVDLARSAGDLTRIADAWSGIEVRGDRYAASHRQFIDR